MTPTEKHLTIRLPLSVHEGMQELARQNRRSLNNEMVVQLEARLAQEATRKQVDARR